MRINLFEFFAKNLFWYSIMVICNKSFNPTDWWIYQYFWGGVLFAIVEIGIFNSTLINDETDGN